MNEWHFGWQQRTQVNLAQTDGQIMIHGKIGIVELLRTRL